MKRESTRGFSVIELLVVIVVLSVLTTMLIPAILKALERSKTIVCVHNLRSVGSLLLTYAREQGPNFEVWYSGSAGTMWNTRLILDGYITHQGLKDLSCPSIEYAAPNGSVSGRHYGIYMDAPEGRIESFTDASNNTGLVYRINVATHSTPSKALFMADSVTSAGAPSVRIVRNGTSIAGGGIHARHYDSANLFFLDGHVETAAKEKLQELGVRSYFAKDLKIITLP